MRDILFDEKIAGSFHFTPGQAYDDCGNGNKSQVHWDMVCIQRPEYGGGEIWFDGRLIRKDGLFVPKALQKLNPDYLLGRGEQLNAEPPGPGPSNRLACRAGTGLPQRYLQAKLLHCPRMPPRARRQGAGRGVSGAQPGGAAARL